VPKAQFCRREQPRVRNDKRTQPEGDGWGEKYAHNRGSVYSNHSSLSDMFTINSREIVEYGNAPILRYHHATVCLVQTVPALVETEHINHVVNSNYAIKVDPWILLSLSRTCIGESSDG